jgi:hypothetical protein
MIWRRMSGGFMVEIGSSRQETTYVLDTCRREIVLATYTQLKNECEPCVVRKVRKDSRVAILGFETDSFGCPVRVVPRYGYIAYRSRDIVALAMRPGMQPSTHVHISQIMPDELVGELQAGTGYTQLRRC